MSILIRGVEMPKGCGVCPFKDDECFGAWKCWRVKDWGDDDNRAKGCPLVPVPPHGRLGDLDELKERIRGRIFEDEFSFEIDRAPIIIPASEEGE